MSTLDTAAIEASIPGLQFATMDGIVQAGGVGFTAAQARYLGSSLDFLYADRQVTATWSGPDRTGTVVRQCDKHVQTECDTDLMTALLAELVAA